MGFLVPDALGNLEADKERMVKTPWFDEAIPFHRAAEVGTQRVISQHSTIGLVVTCDGSFGEIPRENFVESEEQDGSGIKETGEAFSDPGKFSEAISGRNAEAGGTAAGKV